MNFKFLKNYYLGYFFLAFCCVFHIFKATSFDPNDFSNYYFSSYFLFKGEFSASIYEIVNFNIKIKELGYENIFGSFAPNSPFLALFFLPLVLFSLSTAKIIFNCLSCIFLIISLKRLFTYLKIATSYLFLIPFIFFVSLKNGFLSGQVYLILLFFLSEGFIAYKKKQYTLMSFLWGIAILLKVFPLILFAFLLFRKQYRAIIYLTISSIILLGVSISISGWNVWEFYFTTVLPKANNGEIARKEFITNYQSMHMLLKHLFIFNSPENENPIFNNYKLFSSLILFFKLFILGIGFIISKIEKSDIKVFSYWILASLLISPYGSTYSNILLLFLYIAFIETNKKFNKITIVVFITILLIVNMPIHYFENLKVPFSFPRLFFYLILFGIFITPYLKTKSIKLILVFSFPLVLINLIASNFTKKIKYESFFVGQEKVLIYDYYILNNKLTYTYWGKNNLKSKSININYDSLDDKKIVLKNNQIFYQNKQLTFSNDLKRKPIILDNKTILFLSDKGRGLGFFNLKSIPFTLN